ncbi:Peroxin 11c [Carabus blaptoides fortunei]
MTKPNKSILEEICNLLDTYKGRDKILRTLCYSTKLIGGLAKDDLLAKRFQVFSSQMSATRATLRLLDDLPMLKYTLEYGFGKEEPDRIMSSLGVITNIIDQVYYPIEKISWLAEHRLISADGEKWDVVSSIFWVTSIYLTLMKSLRYMSYLQKNKMHATMDAEFKVNLIKIIGRQKLEALTCIRLSLDLIHAISTLPPGFLWSSKLKSWHVGFIGTLSSVLGIYQIFVKKSLQ